MRSNRLALVAVLSLSLVGLVDAQTFHPPSGGGGAGAPGPTGPAGPAGLSLRQPVKAATTSSIVIPLPAHTIRVEHGVQRALIYTSDPPSTQNYQVWFQYTTVQTIETQYIGGIRPYTFRVRAPNTAPAKWSDLVASMSSYGLPTVLINDGDAIFDENMGGEGNGYSVTDVIGGTPDITTLDGVDISTYGDRILVKDQVGDVLNGIYFRDPFTKGFQRATDADTVAELPYGTYTLVAGGTVNAGTGWALTATSLTNLSTNPMPFVKVIQCAP